MDERDGFVEVNALLGAVAKAFDVESEALVRDIEAGAVAMDLQTDGRGERFVAVRYKERVAHIYQGAIRHISD